MRPPSPLTIVALLCALLVAWATAEPSDNNRLVHRTVPKSKRGLTDWLEEAAEGIKEAAEELLVPGGRRKGGATKGAAIKRFVVLHSDATGSKALSLFMDSAFTDIDPPPLWLYGDVNRWNPQHVEHLWNFTCGPTQGRWYVAPYRGISF